MSAGYFQNDTYSTPVNTKPSLFEKLRRNSRLYFIFKYGKIVLKTRRQAQDGIYDDFLWAESSFYIFNFIEKAGGHFEIEGMEHIAESPEPVLFIGNHMSTLETMVLPCIISPRRNVTFVVKESLVRHPLFKDVMLSRNPIVVGRQDPRKDLEAVMNGGLELLKKGISIVIFPQSTRSIEFKPEEFNSLGVKLAKRAGVKVVPVALKTDFWGNGKFIKEIGPLNSSKTIHFRFGEPFLPSGSGKDDNQRIISFIEQSLHEWAD